MRVSALNFLLRIYDWLSVRKYVLWVGLAIVVVALATLSSRLRLTEDIMDFLPVGDEYKESAQIYSKMSDADRIVVIFEGDNADTVCQAIDIFAEYNPDAIIEVDFGSFLSRLDYIYSHLPYFLDENVYLRLDKILNPDSIRVLLQTDKQMLAMPGMGQLRHSVSSDPLRLIPLSKGASGQYAGAQSVFMSHNGYMMTRDGKMCLAFVDSPYGSTESKQNALLVDSLSSQTESVMQLMPSVSIRLLGAPVVAAGNTRRIKHDTVLVLTLTVLMLVLLLGYSFPRKTDILLIMLSVGFGWLMAMAALAMMNKGVSAIGFGIGGILIGIAVNYPLHLLVHRRYTDSVRQTLKEVLSPLIVGNITTVGAFLALLPLNAVALRQLGLFAAVMLVGTILFCILVLPHLMSKENTKVRELPLPEIRNAKMRKWSTWLMVPVLMTALAVPYIKQQPLFDSNLSHINYMTEQQRKDFAMFETLSENSSEPAYLAASARAELTKRLERWNEYWQHRDASAVVDILKTEAAAAGFKQGSFSAFCDMLTQPFAAADLSDVSTMAALWPGRFDSAALNSMIATSLNDNFNYIGLVCSFIVLIFLCLSFRSVKNGIVAFLPMLVSWVLIVALMQLAGIQFNIVNVILATFIFGQGDDYTIFMVEGLIYEKQTGKTMLHQYKQSILLSALLMLVSMGVLVLAKHPAMHSLGTVTFIGMGSVVLMALWLPPVLMRLTEIFNKKKTE